MNKTEAYETIIPFGKYKDFTLRDVMLDDASYANWLTGIDTHGKLHEALEILSEEIWEIYESENDYVDDIDDYMCLSIDFDYD